MEIVVIRHGKPLLDRLARVSPAEFGVCAKAYDAAKVDNRFPPPIKAIQKAKSCRFVVCSDLIRSTQSAQLLELNKPDIVSPLFRECAIPYIHWDYPKLPPKLWTVFFRLLQVSGYSPNAESYSEVKRRTKNCAEQLIELAQSHGSVLFVGHGALGWVLHRTLLDLGWTGPPRSVRNHWEFAVYKANE